MKNKTIGILLLIGFTISTVASVNHYSSSTSTSEISEFEITIQKNDNQIKLTCSKGCAWVELSFKNPDQDHIQKINELGMVMNTSND
jgi:hypothetical protein